MGVFMSQGLRRIVALCLCGVVGQATAWAETPPMNAVSSQGLKAYLTPHWAHGLEPVSVTFADRAYINHGLVGAGYLAARTRDFRGETLGSFSSMALRSWGLRQGGGYRGVILTLPDRGPNDVGALVGTTDYANRLHRIELELLPDGKLKLTPKGGLLLKDQRGAVFTGKEPLNHTLMVHGQVYPSPEAIKGRGHISLDSEGLAMLDDGRFYVSDEYMPGIFFFDKAGRQIGLIPPVEAVVPRVAGQVQFSSAKPPETGRRNNQGYEALSLTPDGRYLVAILQSAPLQDSQGETAAARSPTRVLVYDVSKEKTPKAPIGHYVLLLPVYRDDGSGQPANATAAQSEAIALDQDRLLVLARDGLGRGKDNEKGPVFKAVLLVDLSKATNLAGTPYETTTKPVMAEGRLVPQITAAQTEILVNLLNPDQLGRFGIGILPSKTTSRTVPEKLEAMALAPALDPKAPQDWFLLIGSDNDFQTREGRVAGHDFDGSLKNSGPDGENDSLILVYRLTLPGYMGHPLRPKGSRP